MDFKVIWSEEAIADLRGIYSYIARDDPDVALTVVSGILAHVHILESFPFIVPSYPRRVRGTLREVVFLSYRIFYDVSEESESVEILHVWYGARKEPTF